MKLWQRISNEKKYIFKSCSTILTTFGLPTKKTISANFKNVNFKNVNVFFGISEHHTRLAVRYDRHFRTACLI